MFTKRLVYAFLGILIITGGTLAVLVIARPFSSQPNSVRVVLAYEGQAGYIAAAQADPSADKDALYQKYVTDAYWDLCGYEGITHTILTGSAISIHPRGEMDALAEEVRLLSEADTAKIAKNALQRSAKLLPGSKVTTCIFAIDPYQRSFYSLYMHGFNGYSLGPDLFFLEVAPQGDWLDWLPYIIAHEYHHAVFFQTHPAFADHPMDLLDAFILEGRADSFADVLNPGIEAPWTGALTPEQEATQWQALQDDLASMDQGMLYLFGMGVIPRWTGYTIGFHIVQSYIQAHPEASVREWTEMDARELLRESGYSGQP